MDFSNLMELAQPLWPALLVAAVFIFLALVDRRNAKQVRAMIAEGREVLASIEDRREKVDWLLDRMMEKIEGKKRQDVRKHALDEVDVSLDRILAEYPGAHVGIDWGKEERPIDRVVAPVGLDFTPPGKPVPPSDRLVPSAPVKPRRRMVEVQATDLGDAYVVPAEDAERLAKDVGGRVRTKWRTGELAEAIRQGIHVEVAGPSLRLSNEDKEALKRKFRKDVQAGREIPF